MRLQYTDYDEEDKGFVDECVQSHENLFGTSDFCCKNELCSILGAHILHIIFTFMTLEVAGLRRSLSSNGFILTINPCTRDSFHVLKLCSFTHAQVTI